MYYFTFGFGQLNQGKFVKIEAETYEKAREIMVSVFNDKWAFQYEEDDWFDKDGISQDVKYGYIELNI